MSRTDRRPAPRRLMRSSRWRQVLGALAGTVLAAACRQDMFDQPKSKALGESDFFEDGRAARAPVPGTVARGHLAADEAFETGIGPGGTFLAALPVPLTRALLERGQERFDIFCAPCHDRVGRGRGMIVQRGFKQPSSYHSDRLRAQPIGYYFDVITHGFGEMSSYAAQVPVDDRWAIAAYIRALQLSQHAPLAAVPEADRREIEGSDGGAAAGGSAPRARDGEHGPGSREGERRETER